MGPGKTRGLYVLRPTLTALLSVVNRLTSGSAIPRRIRYLYLSADPSTLGNAYGGKFGFDGHTLKRPSPRVIRVPTKREFLGQDLAW